MDTIAIVGALKSYTLSYRVLVSSQSTENGFLSAWASKDFHYLSRSHQLSETSDCKALRTADPLRLF